MRFPFGDSFFNKCFRPIPPTVIAPKHEVNNALIYLQELVYLQQSLVVPMTGLGIEPGSVRFFGRISRSLIPKDANFTFVGVSKIRVSQNYGYFFGVLPKIRRIVFWGVWIPEILQNPK